MDAFVPCWDDCCSEEQTKTGGGVERDSKCRADGGGRGPKLTLAVAHNSLVLFVFAGRGLGS